ncbi:MAG: tripartite tricarboxylate transporter substrate binding protein [Spirochaetales bacterium]|nr:tripartite tricarboxylate transporter substrate binding protein [Spirochaetales bacterium]
MKKGILVCLILILASSLLFASGASEAQKTTTDAAFTLNRKAEIIISYKAGGGSDRMFRAFQPYLEAIIGQSLEPVYLPGAEGLIGWSTLLSKPADGYTIGVLNIPSATASIVSGDATFGVDDFTYLGNITYEPPLLIIAKNNSWGINNLQDLITYAKANPGKVTMAHTGTGGDEYIAIKLFAEYAGIEVKDVPFEDTASSAAAVLGGHVYCAMTSAYAVLNYLEQDQVIGLAMGSDEREPAFNTIPTFTENGIDLVMGGMRGIVGPKGMSESAVKFWSDAIKQMVNNPDYQKYASENGTMLKYMDAEEFKAAHENLFEMYSEFYKKEPW